MSEMELEVYHRHEMALDAYRLHRFSVDDYHRMGEAGIIPEDSRIELIDGELIEPVAAMYPPHASGVQRLNRMLLMRLGERAEIRCRLPVSLDDYSEPHPDFCVAKFDAHGFAERHPVPSDILLLIEVADSTRKDDRRIKIPLYGRAGVPDSWLVDLVDRLVLIYRNPSPEGYRNVTIARRGETVSALSFPDVQFAVDEMLPPEL